MHQSISSNQLLEKWVKRIAQGFLKVSELHSIYWAEYGNPKGVPVLSIHGGPGSRFKKKHLKHYDEKKCRLIVFDQRGCGNSTPRGEIRQNTTQDLLQDIDRLLDARKVKKAIVVGGSWGSTLALLYAQHNPLKVKALIILAVFLGRAEDANWLFNGASLVYPEYWDKFLLSIPQPKQHDICSYLFEQIQKGNAKAREQAALAIGNYEAAIMVPEPDKEKCPQKAGDDEINDARIYLHYFKNLFFLSDKSGILNNLHKIQHIPTHIVHGRYDMCSPLAQAYLLHKGLPKSHLTIVPGENHYSDKNKGILISKVNAFISRK